MRPTKIETPRAHLRGPTKFETSHAELERLRWQLRELSQRVATEFDRGYAVATRMMQKGLTVQQIIEASGVVGGEYCDRYADTVRLSPTLTAAAFTGDEATEPAAVAYAL